MLNKIFYIYFLFFSFVFADIEKNPLKIQEVKSRYGIKALLFENKNLPIVSVSFVFKNSGYIYDENNKNGIGNLVALILQEGTENKDKLALAKEMAKIGAQITFDVDQENFYCNMVVLPENLNKAFSLFHEIIFSPNLDEQSIKRAKVIQKSTYDKLIDNPKYTAQDAFFINAFAGTPYSNTKYGNEKTLESILVTDIHDFISNTFNRINLSISIVGDIDTKTLITLLDEYIIDFPLTVMNVKKIDKKVKLNSKSEQVNIEKNIPQNIIIFGQNGLSVHDKDFYNLVILNYLLGGSGLKSILMQEIREKKGYTYGISTYLYNSNNLNLIIGSVATSNETANEVIKMVKKTMANLQSTGISETQLENAKDNIINSLLLDLDSSANILNNIVYIQKNDLNADYINTYLDGIRSVNYNSINNFIKSFIDTKLLFFVNVGKIV